MVINPISESFLENYAEAMIKALQERFSDSDLYNALSVFDVKLFSKTERQMEFIDKEKLLDK
ncbi:1905_t:CDS:2 [Funneliformis mosseae]|uniref:1905_t:CDS:1 n=1 Tax=Funneliformis mosseae TaxID=27381 RepID=A0A9N8V1W2_FUNMO|nr:1905_t:CDS:2 [Funneliformis mosseae]